MTYLTHLNKQKDELEGYVSVTGFPYYKDKLEKVTNAVHSTNLLAEIAELEGIMEYETQESNKQLRRPLPPQGPVDDGPDYHLASGLYIDPETGETAGTAVATFEHRSGQQVTPWRSSHKAATQSAPKPKQQGAGH